MHKISTPRPSLSLHFPEYGFYLGTRYAVSIADNGFRIEVKGDVGVVRTLIMDPEL